MWSNLPVCHSVKVRCALLRHSHRLTICASILEWFLVVWFAAAAAAAAAAADDDAREIQPKPAHLGTAIRYIAAPAAVARLEPFPKHPA